MFKVTQNGDNRLDIEINGQLNADQMREMLDQIIQNSQSIKHGKMLYRIENFSLPTLSAIGVELSRLPELFRLISHYDYAALLCDEEWLQKAGEIKGALIPGLEIKAFDLDELEHAEAWLDSKV